MASKEIAEHLNRLGSFGLSNLAPNDVLQELITDYFCDDHDKENEDDWSDDDTPSSFPQSSFIEEEPLEVEELSGVATALPPLDDEDSGHDNLNSDDEEYIPLRFTAEEVCPMELVEESTDDKMQSPYICKKCSLCNGQACSTRFKAQEVLDMRLQCLEMTRQELDVCVLSKLSVVMKVGDMTEGTRHQVKRREVQYTEYRHQGHRICREFFKYLHGLGQEKLYALITHYKAVGIEARVHGNTKRLPHNALRLCDTRRCVDFIVNYAEVHAINLPGRTPYHWKDDVKLLPTNCSKRLVYDSYVVAATAANERVVVYRTFCRIWQELLPFIVTMKPATDLCWFCRQTSHSWAKVQNRSDSVKLEVLQTIQGHLNCVAQERSVYSAMCKSSKEYLGQNATSLGPHDVCSFTGTVHYSFDFAQQIMYPSDPLQPGPIYFKTPRKCALFGVCCEALSSQVNFLIDEVVDVGKGSNCVISMLHYFFQHHGIGETEVHLHADNCSGQNKNNCMMMYLMWRVLTQRHKRVTLSFMITGHTKFSCDWCFGLVKRLYRRTPVNCLTDAARVVSESALGNLVQLCGNENGDVIVPMYDWKSFLETFFRKLNQIKKFHHFVFEDKSTAVKIREYSDSEEIEQTMLISKPPVGAMPEPIAPKGLDLKRQWYLYDEIRDFVLADDDVKDCVAPKPSLPKPTATASTSGARKSNEEGPPAKRKSKGKGLLRIENDDPDDGTRSVKGKGRGKKSK